MYVLAREPRSVQGVIASTFELYRQALGALLPLALIAGTAALVERYYELRHGLPETPEELFADAGYWLVLAITLVTHLLAQGAMWAQADFIARGESMAPGRAFGIGLRALPTMLGSTVLYIVAMTAGLILLIVPGVLVSVSLFLYGPIVILEGKGVIGSVRESHRLVWGAWWHTAVVQLLGGVILIAAAVLALLLVTLLLAPLPADSAPRFVLDLLVTAAVSALATPFFVLLLLELYYDLRLRKGAGGAA
jgi:hypothetical protein